MLGWTDSDHQVHTADLMWFKYSGVSTAIMRGAQGVKIEKEVAVAVLLRGVAVPRRWGAS